MIEYLKEAAPVLIALLLYFFRLEKKITSMATDIDWIKEFCLKSITNPGNPSNGSDSHDLPTHRSARLGRVDRS